MSDPTTMPCRIELIEESGPVSPTYQFSRQLRLWAGDDGVHLDIDERKGRPAKERHLTLDIPVERYRQLWDVLSSQDVMARGGDLVGDKVDRAGVAINHFKLELGDQPVVRFDFMDTQLEEPERAPWRAIVEALRSLAQTTS